MQRECTRGSRAFNRKGQFVDKKILTKIQAGVIRGSTLSKELGLLRFRDIPGSGARCYVINGLRRSGVPIIYIMFTCAFGLISFIPVVSAFLSDKSTQICDALKEDRCLFISNRISATSLTTDGATASYMEFWGESQPRLKIHTWEVAMIERLVEILHSRQRWTGRPISTAELAVLILGSLPDILAWLNRGDQSDLVFIQRVLAGVRVCHRLDALPLGDSIPDYQRDRVVVAIADLMSVLADWSVNAYGDRPSEGELYELGELMQWASRGALFAHVRSDSPGTFEVWKTDYFKTSSVFPDHRLS